MRRLLLIIIGFCTPAALAQQLLLRPAVFGGFAATRNAGYEPLAILGGVGLEVESPHFVLNSEASYDNGHKVSNNDQPNLKGHDRYLTGLAYYRLSSGWFFGPGLRWNQLSTSQFSKSAWGPTLGGGKDYFSHNCAAENCSDEFSMRLEINYVMRGTDWRNGSEGPEIAFYMPSPALKGHFFYRQRLGIYRFHETVTAPSDASLTSEQSSDHQFDAFARFDLLYRF